MLKENVYDFLCANFLRQRHHHYHQYHQRHHHNCLHHITDSSNLYYSGVLIYDINYGIVIQHIIINNTEQQTSKFIHHYYILLYYILRSQSSTITPLYYYRNRQLSQTMSRGSRVVFIVVRSYYHCVQTLVWRHVLRPVFTVAHGQGVSVLYVVCTSSFSIGIIIL